HIWPLRDDVKSSLRQHTEQHKRLDIDENQNERSASSWRREPDRSKNPRYCAKWQTIRRSSVDMSGRAVNRPGSRICTLLPVPMCDVDRIHAEPDAIRKRRKP